MICRREPQNTTRTFSGQHENETLEDNFTALTELGKHCDVDVMKAENILATKFV